jgi:hypothetical protein
MKKSFSTATCQSTRLATRELTGLSYHAANEVARALHGLTRPSGASQTYKLEQQLLNGD